MTKNLGKESLHSYYVSSLFWNRKYLPLNNSHLQLAVLAVLNWDTTRDTSQIIHYGAKKQNLQATDGCIIPGNLSFAY